MANTLSEDHQKRNQRIQERIAVALRRLRQSERGTAALRSLEIFLQNGGAGLDQDNQEQVEFIIKCAFTCPWNLPGGYKLL